MENRSGPPRGKAALAWLVPWVGIAVMWSFASALEDSVGFARWCAVALLVGVLLGVAWYLLYPRPLARRLVPLLAVISVVVLVSGVVGEFASQPLGSVLFTLFGILVGLTFAELRGSRRRPSNASDQPAREAPVN